MDAESSAVHHRQDGTFFSRRSAGFPREAGCQALQPGAVHEPQDHRGAHQLALRAGRDIVNAIAIGVQDWRERPAFAAGSAESRSAYRSLEGVCSHSQLQLALGRIHKVRVLGLGRHG